MREYMTKVTDPEMQELDIQVFGCSHVGGHKYAGNVVIYRPQWKQGVWYGRVQPKDVPQIFEETVLGGRVIGRFWRGGLPDGRWDPKEHITAEEAERRAGETAENSEVMECACAK
jgi:(2Fe-2S) ferredoxin